MECLCLNKMVIRSEDSVLLHFLSCNPAVFIFCPCLLKEDNKTGRIRMLQGTQAAQPVVQGGGIQPGDDGQSWLACDVIQQHKGFVGESLSRKGILVTINWRIMWCCEVPTSTCGSPPPSHQAR